MLSQRWRPLLFGILAIAIIWGVALGGYHIAQNAKTTPEKVRTLLTHTDFAHLSPADRARALKKLEDMLNSLSLQDRRNAHLDREINSWFAQMTEQEKGEFLEATLPTGFKQMLTAFEELPQEKRARAIDDALKRMRASQADPHGPKGAQNTSNGNNPVVSKELEAKVRSAGLKTFYSESSAQTKAELAPVLEELQRSMESGRVFHGN